MLIGTHDLMAIFFSFRSDLGVLGSFYHYLTLGSTTPTPPPPATDLDPQKSIDESSPGTPSHGDAAAAKHPSAADLFRLIYEADRGVGGQNFLSGNTAAYYLHFLQYVEVAAVNSCK